MKLAQGRSLFKGLCFKQAFRSGRDVSPTYSPVCGAELGLALFPIEVPSPCEAPSSPGPIAVTGAQVIQGTAQGADLETVPAKAE